MDWYNGCDDEKFKEPELDDFERADYFPEEYYEKRIAKLKPSKNVTDLIDNFKDISFPKMVFEETSPIFFLLSLFTVEEKECLIILSKYEQIEIKIEERRLIIKKCN